MRSLMLSFAMLSATGFSASVWAKNADDAVDQTAMAIPRIGMPGARSVALPQPLSPGDVARVRRVFTLQRAGSVTEATHEMEGLESDLLRGSILADRYLDTAYLPDAAELSAWLARFGDQPDAPAIRALLETVTHPMNQSPARSPGSAAKASHGQKATPGISARTLLVQNEDQAAVDAARALLSGNPPAARVADSLFSGGVAAWRLNDFTAARPLFEAAWEASDTPAARAASAFWIARVADKTHDRGGRVFWLRRAAKETDTFYGPIARHALNPIIPCLPMPSTTRPVVSNADVDSLMATAAGRRSFALLQIGERDRAEAELRVLWLDSGPKPALGRSLILVAKAVGLDEFADELRSESDAAEAALGKFELPLLRPTGGFRMDPAFVYAVVRHESNFQPLAVSPVGARGLMQVMPATAVSIGAIGDGQTDRLNDPSTNLAIGQRYLIQLGDNPLVGDDLLRLIAAYGQGPTGMNRWAEAIRSNGDPFLFLEATPSPFMRQFVEDVLVFHWQYASAMRLRASSLDDLAAGIYPRFSPIKAVPGGMRARPETCPAPALKG
jgi:soluble lytic murein transglycosylase-like protein